MKDGMEMIELTDSALGFPPNSLSLLNPAMVPTRWKLFDEVHHTIDDCRLATQGRKGTHTEH